MNTRDIEASQSEPRKASNSIYGYFSDPTQLTPACDPGLDVLCPYSHKPLTDPITISFMVPGDSRSFFYRANRDAYRAATQERIWEVEGDMVDSLVELRNSGGSLQ